MWSWMSFAFVEPIFKVATSRTVDDTDVWTLSPFFQHKNLFTKYLKYNHQYVPRPTAYSAPLTCAILSRYPSHSLLRFLLASNSLDLILDVMLEAWGAVVGEIYLTLSCHNIPTAS